jgi:hypothetical protein
LSAQFPWPPTATGTPQTGINHFYSCIWIQQTALYWQGRVSLALWCRTWLVFSKTWVKNQQEWIPAVVRTISLAINAATGTQQLGINHFYSPIWIQQTALHVQGRVSLVRWCRAVWFSAKLGSKNQ